MGFEKEVCLAVLLLFPISFRSKKMIVSNFGFRELEYIHENHWIWNWGLGIIFEGPGSVLGNAG